MQTLTAIANPDSLRRLSAMLGLCTFIAGVISFSGWVLDIPRLTSWTSSEMSIQPNTAVLIILASIAILLLPYAHGRITFALGGLVALGGAANLLQYMAGADFGYNHQLLFGRDWGQAGTLSPGRFGPLASTSFVLLGVCLGLLGLGKESRRYVPRIALVVVLFMTFSLLGYLFDARSFYAVPWLSAIALPSAIMFLLLAIALILHVPDQHPVLMLCERSSAGTMARTVLPIMMILIPVVTWLRVIGYELELFDLGTGRAYSAAILMISVAGLMWVALLALRRRELAGRDADRRKDEFLATLAHELRNPLAPISNAVSILKLAGNNPDVFGRATEIIERQTGHLVRLVDDLLDLSRISLGKMELRRRRIEIADVIQQAVEICSPVAQAAHHDVVVDLPARPIFMEADPVRLAQVVNNLLNNACKFAGQNGRINLTIERRDYHVVITVKDNGIGIPPDMLAFIFEMFSQIDQSLERAQNGLGIGLTLAKQLVELHGGKIEARSEGLGKGSEFIITLPIAIDQTPPPEILQDLSRLGATGRILIVDDNVDSAKSLIDVLRLTGNETFMATDGEEAVVAAERLRPDAILLDIGLPKLNGYDACRRIRENEWAKNILIIALTGWGQDEDRRKSAEAGFDVHMVKPVNLAELLHLLARLPQRQD